MATSLVDDEDYASIAAASASIGDYIDNFYNLVRRHSFLDYVSPIELELKRHIEEKAALSRCPRDLGRITACAADYLASTVSSRRPPSATVADPTSSATLVSGGPLPPPTSGRDRGLATALTESLVEFWIDRPLAFLRRKKYRHYRTMWGAGMTRTEWLESAPQRRASRLREAARPRVVRRLLREWRCLKSALRAVARGETMLFEIGHPFITDGRVWVCTDVGSRTIAAVLLEDLDGSDDSGPPYSIVERTLDRYEMDHCEPAPARLDRSHSSRQR